MNQLFEFMVDLQVNAQFRDAVPDAQQPVASLHQQNFSSGSSSGNNTLEESFSPAVDMSFFFAYLNSRGILNDDPRLLPVRREFMCVLYEQLGLMKTPAQQLLAEQDAGEGDLLRMERTATVGGHASHYFRSRPMLRAASGGGYHGDHEEDDREGRGGGGPHAHSPPTQSSSWIPPGPSAGGEMGGVLPAPDHDDAGEGSGTTSAAQSDAGGGPRSRGERLRGDRAKSPQTRLSGGHYDPYQTRIVAALQAVRGGKMGRSTSSEPSSMSATGGGGTGTGSGTVVAGPGEQPRFEEGEQAVRFSKDEFSRVVGRSPDVVERALCDAFIIPAFP